MTSDVEVAQLSGGRFALINVVTGCFEPTGLKVRHRADHQWRMGVNLPFPPIPAPALRRTSFS